MHLVISIIILTIYLRSLITIPERYFSESIVTHIVPYTGWLLGRTSYGRRAVRWPGGGGFWAWVKWAVYSSVKDTVGGCPFRSWGTGVARPVYEWAMDITLVCHLLRVWHIDIITKLLLANVFGHGCSSGDRLVMIMG